MANSNDKDRPIVDEPSCIAWLNHQLAETDITVTTLRKDLADGLVLATLVNVLAKEQAVDLTKRKFKVMFFTTCLTVFYNKGFCKEREPPSIFIEGNVKAIVDFFKEVQSKTKKKPTTGLTRTMSLRNGDIRWNLKQKQEELTKVNGGKKPKPMVRKLTSNENNKMTQEKSEKEANEEEDKVQNVETKTNNQRSNKEEAPEVIEEVKENNSNSM